MSRNRFGFLERHGAVHWRFCFLVASHPVRDLLLCAKHLFVAAMVAIVLAANSEAALRARPLAVLQGGLAPGTNLWRERTNLRTGPSPLPGEGVRTAAELK